MKTIKVTNGYEIPKNYTGIVEFSDGPKYWYKNGEFHREDGPAIEWADGYKRYYLEGIYYKQINLNDFVFLDSYIGKRNLVWYKLLTEDEIVEYPDIPGLIEK